MHGEFNPGDSVKWVHACYDPMFKNAVGTVVAVIESDPQSPGFAIYEVEFSVGRVTLYGNQIEPASPGSIAQQSRS